MTLWHIGLALVIGAGVTAGAWLAGDLAGATARRWYERKRRGSGR